ncbi:MAG TPA: hypothetical protein VFS19_03675 [Planctomycetota bacterium]|nr:hypothetical protein [Planctomycetota bacterium]
MLAQLDKVDGVHEARVDWTGKTLLIRVKDSADPDVVAAHATRHLGRNATRLSERRAAECVDGFRRGEPWLRAGETLQLSKHESKVLGKSLAAKAGGSLDEKSRARLQEILEGELFALFSRIHAGEFTLEEGLERAARESGPRLHQRLLEFLSPDQATAVMESLRSQLFGRD